MSLQGEPVRVFGQGFKQTSEEVVAQWEGSGPSCVFGALRESWFILLLL